MKIFLQLSLLLLLLNIKKQSFGQKLCGIDEPTTLEKEALLARFKEFSKNTNNKGAKLQTYRVAVRPNIVYNNSSQNGLTEKDVRAIISYANTMLSNANIELYVLRDSVIKIVSPKYADFTFAVENEMRAKYDVLDGINIYFLRSMTQSDLSILNGYTTLPNLSSNSNRIFYSYNNRSADDYNNLYYKLFLHEIGHYFGLLHTFQDGSSNDISKRELVTRYAGSNCSSTGDQLCDTQADPFDRIENFSVYACAEQVPTDLQDALGDAYSPPVDNIMSYFLKCGNIFTVQQYQKMQASFGTRFSPTAEYKIIAPIPNAVSITQLDKKAYCIGDSIKISYNLAGLFDANNALYVDISDKNGENFTRVNNKIQNGDLIIGVPNFPEGDDYRVRITATRPETVSAYSENFSIRTFPTAQLSSNLNTIYKGDSVLMNVNFTGSGMWSFQLSDGMLISNTRQNPYTFYKKPDINTNYSLLFTKMVVDMVRQMVQLQ